MCITCWDEAGSPTVWNSAVAEVARLIDELYELEDCSTGGPLHAVIDDWNLGGTIEPYWFGSEAPELVAFVTDLATKLNALTMDERLSAVAHHDRFAREGVPVVRGAHS